MAETAVNPDWQHQKDDRRDDEYPAENAEE
jgi:hypothetical protein